LTYLGSRKPVPFWEQSRNSRRSWRVRSRVAQCPQGQFEVYNIANNQITEAALFSQVGLDWQLGGGFAVDSPSGSIASMGNSSQVAQLLKAMAGFGGSSGAADGLNAAPLGIADAAAATWAVIDY